QVARSVPLLAARSWLHPIDTECDCPSETSSERPHPESQSPGQILGLFASQLQASIWLDRDCQADHSAASTLAPSHRTHTSCDSPGQHAEDPLQGSSLGAIERA